MRIRRIFWLCLTLFILSAWSDKQRCSVKTYAGTQEPGCKNGKLKEAAFNEPFGICVDKKGNIFVADTKNNCIRKISVEGQVTMYAGTGKAGYRDGPADHALFDSPAGVCLDKDGTMYVAGFGENRIRKISAEGMVTTVAGTGEEGYQDGPDSVAKFSNPRGVVIDSKGNLYVGDSWNHRIRKIDKNGYASTFAGGGVRGEYVKGTCKDGRDTSARFYAPCGVAIDQYDNIYVADALNHRIRKITPQGEVSTAAGSLSIAGHQDGDFNTAIFCCPTELFADTSGEIFVSDSYGFYIRKIDREGYVSTLAGLGKQIGEKWAPDSSIIGSPRGIVKYGSKIFFADHTHHSIMVLTQDGVK